MISSVNFAARHRMISGLSFVTANVNVSITR